MDLEMIAKSVFTALEHLGYIGIIGIMAIESTILPVIIPSEIFLVTYGVLAYKGEMNLFLVIGSASLGILLGSFINYYMAAWLGRAFLHKYGKYVFLSEERLIHWEEVFLRYSKFVIFIGRFIPIPAVKHIVTIPAGLSRMDVKVFAFLTTLGGAIFSAMVVGFGYWFGKRTEVLENFSAIIRTFIYAFVVVSIIFYILYKIYNTFMKNTQKKVLDY